MKKNIITALVVAGAMLMSAPVYAASQKTETENTTEGNAQVIGGVDGSTDIFSSAWGGLPVIWQIRRQRMRNGVERKRIPPAWRSSFHVSYHRTQQDGVQYPMGNRKEKYIPLGRLWMSNPRKASEQSIILLDMSIVQQ